MSYRISEYNLEWPQKFQDIKKNILEIFGNKALQIEHVGSTSIPGMKAKPLIDALVLVKNIDDLGNQKKAMQMAGYSIRENVLEPRSLLFEKRQEDEKIENIHIFEENSPKAKQQLLMKEYYLTHPDIVKKYEDLKEELFKKFPNDYKEYRLGKTDFLNEVEKLAREWKDSCSKH